MCLSIDERAYWVAWSRLSGLGGSRIQALNSHFGSLARAWEAPERALLDVPGLGPTLAAAAAAHRRTTDPRSEWETLRGFPMTTLTWLDPGYPAPLRELPDPPPVLYVCGELPGWERAIAIVGMRKASDYGRRVARILARDLAAVGAVVVSGVAAGIDKEAHEGALDVPDGLTVGVLGCGFKHVFPEAHRVLYRRIADRCALLTEFPPDVKPMPMNFPARNRLVAGLSRGTVVVEGMKKSGSLITAEFALEQGRSVFAVPGPVGSPGSEGPHALLRQGARLVADVQDVLEELGWALLPAGAPSTDDPAERAVLAFLAEGPRHVEAIAAGLGQGVAETGALLLTMELKALVRQLPGMRYDVL